MSRTLTTGKAATPQRWQEAAKRARRKGVDVRRVSGPDDGGTETWTASSASDGTRGYLMRIRDGLVEVCGCEAATKWADPVCHHRAAYYLLVGKIVLPAPAEEISVS